MVELERIVTDIDRRVDYISVQAGMMGADRNELVAEQYKTLLSSYSMLRTVNMNMISRICEHLHATDVFTRDQLSALSASLRAALSAAAEDKPPARKMQHAGELEHYLTADDWTQLEEFGKPPKPKTSLMEEIVATRMHSVNIVCPDVDTCKRASAIVQSSMPCVNATPTDTRDIVNGVRDKLKKLDKGSKWAFQYITTYPRTPFQLPPEILYHAYGKDKPISMPDKIKKTTFRLKVAGTKYNKIRLKQTEPSLEIAPHVPLSPTPEQHVMNAGPFAELLNYFMHQMPHVGTQNTGIQFTSRIRPQLGNGGNQAFTTLAAGGTSTTSDISDGEDVDPDDELAKVEASMAIAKKAVVKKTAEAKAEKEAAAEKALLAKAAEVIGKKATKEKKAATPAGGKAAAPTTKGKTGKGKAVASTGKGKAVVSKGKAPAAVGVGPPGVFDIESWIPTHIKRDEAKAEPKRRNFVSNAHKRSHSAAFHCGVVRSSDLQPITKRARDAAGKLHDSIHLVLKKK